jgi:hypothetical protein
MKHVRKLKEASDAGEYQFPDQAQKKPAALPVNASEYWHGPGEQH